METNVCKHTLSVLVENESGVLSQVSRLFSRKGFNIESLAVGVTDDPKISRITIIIICDSITIKQIANQLAKLLPVLSVKILEPEKSISRELILMKVSATEKEKRDEIIQIVNIFRAKIIDVGLQSVTVEITGNEEKTKAIVDLLEHFGILEIVRTGVISLERGQYTINDLTKEKEEYSYGKNVL